MAAGGAQRLTELPGHIRSQLRVVILARHNVTDRNAFMTRRRLCFEEAERFERRQQAEEGGKEMPHEEHHHEHHRPFGFTHVYLVRTETAWCEHPIADLLHVFA